MRYFIPKPLKRFLGRELELAKISEFVARPEAGILVVYGRRRVGKTELIQHAFAKRKLLKFEGIEGKGEAFQRAHVLRVLAEYTGKPVLAAEECTTWIQVFERIAPHIRRGECSLYFEEVQWLAAYKDSFVSELKYAWDNYFRNNDKLKLILCGSSPSFFHSKVLRSKALYNRSMMELRVEQFSLAEARAFYGPANTKALFDAYLTVGGIPLYLNEIRGRDSVYAKMAKASFVPGAFFLDEFDRIFVSSFAQHPSYRKTLEIVSAKTLCSREAITKGLGQSSGAGVTKIINELVLCGFLEEVRPVSLSNKNKIIRYRIRDFFLHYYFSFIVSKKNQALAGQYQKEPTKAISYERYRAWLGYSFERFCRGAQVRIAELLGFSGVEYVAGSMYQKKSLGQGYQIDLAFKRRDKVLTFCECKYSDLPVGVSVIAEFEHKVAALGMDSARWSVQRVLITASGGSDELRSRGYFDRVIGLEELE